MLYTVHKAKTQFSRLLREAESGKEVLIARGKGEEPEFRLVSLRTARSGSRMEPDPALKRGAVVPGPEFLARPLPDDEWGDLAR